MWMARRAAPTSPPPAPAGGFSTKRHVRAEGGGVPVALRSSRPGGASGAPTFDRAAYRARNVGKRLINRLKQFRRIATRDEKRAANYRAVVTIAAILL
jgi:transposase